MAAKDRPYGREAAGAGDLGTFDQGEPVGTCPSCNAQLSIGETTDPRTRRPAKILVHPMPFCHYFGATDPDEIMRAILHKN